MNKKIVVPSNFRGQVAIFYNFNEAKFSNEKEPDTIFIDSDGIQTVDFNIDPNKWNPEYLYKDNVGAYHKLEIYKSYDEGDSARGVYRDGTFGVYGNSDSLHYRCIEFIIAEKASVTSYLSPDSVSVFEQKIQKKLKINW